MIVLIVDWATILSAAAAVGMALGELYRAVRERRKAAHEQRTHPRKNVQFSQPGRRCSSASSRAKGTRRPPRPNRPPNRVRRSSRHGQRARRSRRRPSGPGPNGYNTPDPSEHDC
jgi:hypothetical protein